MKPAIRLFFLAVVAITGSIGFASPPKSPAELQLKTTSAPRFWFASPPKSPAELRDRIESALRSNDTNAFFALYNWNGVADETIAFQKEMVNEVFTKEFKGTVEISSAQIGPEQTADLETVMGDYRYFPNLEMVGQISVSPSKEKAETNSLEDIYFSGLGLFFGKTNGNFYLPGMVREKLSATAPRPVSLGISVSAWFPKHPCLLNGSYTYTHNGRLTTNSFVATNNLALAFWGDSIQMCQVARDTNECAIKLTIQTNGQEIFNSGLISHTNTIQYQVRQ